MQQPPFSLYLRQDNPDQWVSDGMEKGVFSAIDRRAARAENHFLWNGKGLLWVDHEAGNLEIDFLSPKRRWRLQNISRANEPLLRALDWHGERPQRVFDLTAGLGSDASLLLFAGFDVTLFERNPILQLLLTYGLHQLRGQSPEEGARIRLIEADAIQYLPQLALADRPDLIYLDPMYPTREKSALVKKELRIIRHLVGADHDSETLLQSALKIAPKRVVVKRPQGAPYVGDLSPNHTIESPNTRYDVYLPQL